MSQGEFEQRVEHSLDQLEQALDAYLDELDYESSGGMLTVEFDNGSTLVFSRQPASSQLWLAARSGGYHFEYDEAAGDWRCTRSGDLFRDRVVAEFRDQGGIDIELA